MHTLSTLVVGIYSGVCAALTLLALYRLALLCAWWRTRRTRAAAVAPDPPAEWPRVTVQLPLFNERWVARRLLEAMARLDYPRDRLQIQVLDDSTDRTAVLSRRIVRLLVQRGFDAAYLHRTDRRGYKAGALSHGLQRASGELIAIFDADFVPPPDFLRRAVPSVLLPGVGVVQARWGHLNRDASWFTRLQSVLLDGHFAVEQPARHGRGWLLTFNGTAGVWRRQAIEAAGGWTSDTLTEDLDLSMRAQLAGWRIEYRNDIVVPAELPADSNSFRSQQRRWTKGGVQVARKVMPRILRSRLPLGVRVEAALHLVSYAAYPLLIALALLRTPARLLSTNHAWFGLMPGELTCLVVGTMPLVLFYWIAQRAVGAPGSNRRLLCDAVPAMALGAGLALGNALAVLEGLFGRGLVFERTPKRGDLGAGRTAAGTRARFAAAYRSAGTRTALFELALLAYLVACKILAGRWRWTEFPFLAFFTFGLLMMSLPSLRQAWDSSRKCPGRALS